MQTFQKHYLAFPLISSCLPVCLLQFRAWRARRPLQMASRVATLNHSDMRRKTQENSFGRPLVGVWVCGVWNGHFPESEKYSSDAEAPGNSAERTIFAKFQAPKFENSEPPKMEFHTPSHSIPPLDSLLFMAFSEIAHERPGQDHRSTFQGSVLEGSSSFKKRPLLQIVLLLSFQIFSRKQAASVRANCLHTEATQVITCSTLILQSLNVI